MRGNCEGCNRYGELKDGLCIICNPLSPSKQKKAIEKRLENFKKSQLRRNINNRFRGIPKERIQRPRKGHIRMIDFMKGIWDRSVHVSFISGEPLTFFSHWKMAHVLPKSYTKWKKKEFNIVLMTEGQHHQQHTLPRSELEKMHPGWIAFFALQDEYRLLYNTNQTPTFNPWIENT